MQEVDILMQEVDVLIQEVDVLMQEVNLVKLKLKKQYSLSTEYFLLLKY